MKNFITSGNHTFELVETIPVDHVIWNIGKNMIDGYLPICQAGGHDGCQVIPGSLKAIKIEGAQTILAAVGRGQKTIADMERYVKRYGNSKNKSTLNHVKKLEAALQVMYLIKWE